MYYQFNGSSVRLAGSMHLIPPGAEIPRWISDAYEWSEEIYLEANNGDAAKAALLPVGKSNESKIPADLWAALKARWPANQWYGAIGPQKLWFMAMVAALSGVPLVHGVEPLLTERAKADSREIKYLEGMGEFARLMDRVTDADYVRAFTLILNSSVDTRSRKMADTYAAWVSGQTEAVAAVMRTSPISQFPVIREVIFDARNAMWLPRIVNILSSQMRTVIFVGARHLGGSYRTASDAGSRGTPGDSAKGMVGLPAFDWRPHWHSRFSANRLRASAAAGGRFRKGIKWKARLAPRYARWRKIIDQLVAHLARLA